MAMCNLGRTQVLPDSTQVNNSHGCLRVARCGVVLARVLSVSRYRETLQTPANLLCYCICVPFVQESWVDIHLTRAPSRITSTDEMMTSTDLGRLQRELG